MKKLTILAIALLAVSFTACKKDRVCTCTYSSTEPGYPTMTFELTIVDEKKSIAKAACIKRVSEYTSGTSTYIQTSDCKLK